MQALMQTAPVSDMNRQSGKVLAMLDNGPLALMARSEPAAVMVSPDQWNAISRRLQRYETIAEIRQSQERVAKGEQRYYSHEELIAEIRKRHGDDVADQILE